MQSEGKMLCDFYLNLCPQVRFSRKERTFQNYETWLTPFVEWIEAQAVSRPVVVTSRTISEYLEQHARYRTSETYHRVGSQIVDFVNRFLFEKVHLIKGLGFDLKHDNVNLPEQSVGPID